MSPIKKSTEKRKEKLNYIGRLINQLPLELKEQLISSAITSMPDESKERLVRLIGLTVIGSNFLLNAQLCMQIQNAPNINVPAIIRAAAHRHQRDCETVTEV